MIPVAQEVGTKMRKIGLVMSLVVGITFLSACGQGVDPLFGLNGVDPLLVGQGTLIFPLESPYGQSYFTILLGSGNEWTLGPAIIGTQVKAPAAGYIVGLDQSQQSITVMHNSRLSTRIRGVTATGVTLGSFVGQNQLVGTLATLQSSGIPFAVILDNAIVCPLSFLTAAARQQILSTTTFAQLCPT
jgi:hypothetical protein